MIARMLMLVVLIAQMMLNTVDASDDDDEERGNMGGEGFANVVTFVALLGVLLLAVVIVLGILSMIGQFEMEFFDPEI